MKLESTFHNAKMLMRWGAIGMLVCALFAFIAVADFEVPLLIALAGYVGALLCYMSGAYLFSKATNSSLFMLNCARFFLLLVFITTLWVLLGGLNDDIFDFIVIYLSCAIFSVAFMLLEHKVIVELFAKTGVRYFVLGFRTRLFFVLMFAGICVFLAFSIGAGIRIELQPSTPMLNSANALRDFWQQNPLVLVYYAIVLGMLISLLVSSLLYIMAYWKISTYNRVENIGCKGFCGCK